MAIGTDRAREEGRRRAAQTALLALAGAVSVLALAAPAGADNAAIVAALNAERTANAIPAGVTENPTWSADCANHNHYEVLNGNTIVHGEAPGNPGYTSGGNTASLHAVLAQGPNGIWANGDPWEWAPYHLLQVLHPALSTTGVAESEGFNCLTTSLDYSRAPSSPNAIYSWPGAGRSDAPWYEIPAEEPGVPEQNFPGFSPGAYTGPAIMLYWFGSGPQLKKLQTATLKDPSNNVVPADLLNDTNDNAFHLTLDDTGFLLVHQPLTPSTTYTLNATFVTAMDTMPYSQAITFTTAPAPDPSTLMTIANAPAASGAIHFQESVKSPLGGDAATEVFDYGHGVTLNYRDPVAEGSFFNVTAPRPGSSVTLTIKTAAFSIGTTTFPGRTFTSTYTKPGPPPATPTTPTLSHKPAATRPRCAAGRAVVGQSAATHRHKRKKKLKSCAKRKHRAAKKHRKRHR